MKLSLEGIRLGQERVLRAIDLTQMLMLLVLVMDLV